MTRGDIVVSVIRAAGELPIKTVGDPLVITPPVAVASPIRAAGPPANALAVVKVRVKTMIILHMFLMPHLNSI
jgi:hypothetical protein